MKSLKMYLKYKKDPYSLWKWCMNLGEHSGCHQLPERSFYFHGYQLPVCARCSGAILGYIIAIPAFFLFGFYGIFSVFCLIPMTIDWFIQFFKIKESTNRRRLITGILGGYGILSLQLYLFKTIFLKLR